MQVALLTVCVLLVAVLSGCNSSAPYAYEASPKFEAPKGNGAIRRLREVGESKAGTRLPVILTGERRVHAIFVIPRTAAKSLTVSPIGVSVRAIEVVDSAILYERDGWNVVLVTGHVPMRTRSVSIVVDSDGVNSRHTATLALEVAEFGLYYDVPGLTRIREGRKSDQSFVPAVWRSRQITTLPTFRLTGEGYWCGAYHVGASWLLVSTQPKRVHGQQ